MRNKKNKLLFITFLTLLFQIFLNLFESKIYYSFIFFSGLFTIFYIGWRLYQLRKHSIAFIMLFLIMVYFGSIFLAFVNKQQISIYIDFQEQIHLQKTFLIYIYFIFILLFFLVEPSNFQSKTLTYPRSNLGFAVSILILITIIITGKSGENIFEGGGYVQSNSIGYTFNEYFSFFLVLALLCVNHAKKFPRAIIYILSLLYCIKCFLFGARAEIVEVFLVIIFFFYAHRLTTLKTLAILTLGFFLTEIAGIVRVYTDLIISFSFADLVELYFNAGRSSSGIISSNQGDVFYAANRIISLDTNGLIPQSVKINSFLSLFLPFSFFPDSDLASFATNMYPAGGGGLIFGYFYVWFGIFGVTLSAILISKVINSLTSNNPSLYAIFVFPYFIRWYAYNPVTLFKQVFICIIIYNLFIYFERKYKIA